MRRSSLCSGDTRIGDWIFPSLPTTRVSPADKINAKIVHKAYFWDTKCQTAPKVIAPTSKPSCYFCMLVVHRYLIQTYNHIRCIATHNTRPRKVPLLSTVSSVPASYSTCHDVVRSQSLGTSC